MVVKKFLNLFKPSANARPLQSQIPDKKGYHIPQMHPFEKYEFG